MAAQVAPDLLGDQFRGLRAQYCARTSLVGLELVEGALDLPALRVGSRQLGCGGRAVIQQGGDQPVRAGRVTSVFDRVADHPDPARVPAGTVGGGVEDVGQEGPVG